MTALTPLLVPCITGFLASKLLLRNVPLPKKGLLIAAVSPALGMGIVSLVVFAAYLVNARHAKFTFLLLNFLLLFALLILCFQQAGARQSAARRQAACAPRTRVSILIDILFVIFFLFCFRHFCHYFWGYASWNVFGGWDARYMWHLKARFLFREPQYWQAMFSPEVGWHHQDYPLLLPASIAWGWSWFEREVLIWPAILAFVFISGLGGLLMWYLWAYASGRAALLAGAFFFSTPAYRFWAAALYADIPFTFYATLSIFMLICAFRMRHSVLFFLSGLAGGLAAWTKNEGLLLLLVMVFLLAAVLVRDKSASREQKYREFCWFIGGCAVPAAAVFCLKIISRVPSYFFEKKGLSGYMTLIMDSERSRLIAAAFLVFKMNFAQWQGLWALFAAALVVYAAGRRKRTASFAWLAAAFVLLIEAGYFAVYLITPVQLGFHLGTSLIRLMLHTGAAALAFSFETFAARDRFSSDV